MQRLDNFEVQFLDAFVRYAKRKNNKHINNKKLQKKKEKLSFLKGKKCDFLSISLYDDKVAVLIHDKEVKYLITFYDYHNETYTGILDKDGTYRLEEGVAVELEDEKTTAEAMEEYMEKKDSFLIAAEYIQRGEDPPKDLNWKEGLSVEEHGIYFPILTPLIYWLEGRKERRKKK